MHTIKIISILAISFFLCLTSAYAEKLTVLLDWFANPDHAPLFVAEQQGFFKAQELDVQLIGPADPSDPPKLVAAGKADIAITYEPQLMEQIDEGLPLIRIGTLIDQPLNCLVVLADSSIKTIADLKGKNVGYSTGDVSSVALKTMLENNNLSLSDVKHINVHYDLSQALLTKRIDAATGMIRTFEPIQLELAGHPARLFLPEKNGVPNYSELVFVVNKNNVTDKRFKRFMLAVAQGTEYLRKNPQLTWEQFAKSHPELNDELNRRAWFATLPYFTKDPNYFNKTEWIAFADYMHKNKLIKKTQPIATYAINISQG
jgi:putative hydroxymethylpyrimidine transport system substrate-binding protein